MEFGIFELKTRLFKFIEPTIQVSAKEVASQPKRSYNIVLFSMKKSR